MYFFLLKHMKAQALTNLGSEVKFVRWINISSLVYLKKYFVKTCQVFLDLSKSSDNLDLLIVKLKLYGFLENVLKLK